MGAWWGPGRGPRLGLRLGIGDRAGGEWGLEVSFELVEQGRNGRMGE